MTAGMRPERPGRAMAVDAGRAHWQRRAKRAAASAAAPCPASAERALLPLLGKFKSKQASVKKTYIIHGSWPEIKLER